MAIDPAPTNESAAKSDPLDVGPLPMLRSTLPVPAIIERLSGAARRGKLPGFKASTPGSASLFTLTDFGTPFESVLEATSKASSVGTDIEFTIRMKTGLAWVFFATLVFTVWPGVWLTDSLLRTYFTSYDVRTWIWYLPLTAPFVPMAMWTAIKRSRRSARAEAKELIQRVGNLLTDH